MADEGDFIELLVASERVEKWLAVIRDEKFNLSRWAGAQVLRRLLKGGSAVTGRASAAAPPRPAPPGRRVTQAAAELCKAVEAREAYAEEVCVWGEREARRPGAGCQLGSATRWRQWNEARLSERVGSTCLYRSWRPAP